MQTTLPALTTWQSLDANTTFSEFFEKVLNDSGYLTWVLGLPDAHHRLARLNTLFDEAFANAQLIPQESVPQNMQLVLYGLYKQATSERTNQSHYQNPQDLINAFKLNAWMQVKHLTVDEAKEKYIEIINTLLKERNL